VLMGGAFQRLAAGLLVLRLFSSPAGSPEPERGTPPPVLLGYMVPVSSSDIRVLLLFSQGTTEEPLGLAILSRNTFRYQGWPPSCLCWK